MTDLENKEAFEKWAADETGMNLDRDMAGQYVSITTFMSWEAWQASAQRQGFKFVPLEPTEEMIKQAEQLYIVEGVDIFSAVINAV